jgi:hypothetical protein
MPERLVAAGRLVRLFATASAAYGEPLVIEPTEDAKRILISCGESFLGLLMPIRSEDGSTVANELNAWRDGWMHRLPELAHAGGGKLPESPKPGDANFLRDGTGFHGSVTVSTGNKVQDITDAVFNRVAEIVEPHL